MLVSLAEPESRIAQTGPRIGCFTDVRPVSAPGQLEHDARNDSEEPPEQAVSHK